MMISLFCILPTVWRKHVWPHLMAELRNQLTVVVCPQFCVVRNWVVRNFYPVHSFLKPAAFDCGPLIASPGATSVTTSAPAEDPTAVRTPRTEPRQRGKKSAEGVQEQISRDEASPLHRHGTPEDMRNWPSQGSLSVIG